MRLALDFDREALAEIAERLVAGAPCGEDGRVLGQMMSASLGNLDHCGSSSASTAIAGRDELIRQHDRQFNDPGMSLTQRGKAIASDLSKAAQITLPTTIRMVSAKAILTTTNGKTLKYRRVIDIIRPV